MSDIRPEHRAHSPIDATGTIGRVLHSARGYDLLAWLFLRGRERVFREKILDLARVGPGDSLLDVGCGTGTLAIVAKERTGATGVVHGIDAAAEMIERAARKAKGAGLDVVFQRAIVEALPFPEATFDVVLSTLMLHHLPRAAREQCARELRRVAKRGGRVVAVDFGAPMKRGLLAHFHRHGHVKLPEILRLLTEAGLVIEESGPLGIHDLQFVVARAP